MDKEAKISIAMRITLRLDENKCHFTMGCECLMPAILSLRWQWQHSSEI
jgi:hypothetical protein